MRATEITAIHQLAESLELGDGVTSIVRRAAAILATLGEQGEILARPVWTPAVLAREALPCHEILATPTPSLLFHYWGHNTSTWAIYAVAGRKAVWYHNITPPRFFRPGTHLHRLTTEGYAQLGQIASQFDLVIGDSHFNVEAFGAYLRRPRPSLHIYPVVEAAEERAAPVDAALLAALRGTGETNLLFVGRLAGNKRQDDIMRAFDAYRRSFDPSAHLWLVGNDSDVTYRRELEALRRALPSGDAITFTGKVSDAAMRAYLQAADVLVCASEHEGFCIPVAHAMALDIPVVARAAAAVPETLGGGGLLVQQWEPYEVAALIHAARTDPARRAEVLARQRAALARFSSTEARARLAAVVDYLRTGKWSPLFEWLHPAHAAPPEEARHALQ